MDTIGAVVGSTFNFIKKILMDFLRIYFRSTVTFWRDSKAGVGTAIFGGSLFLVFIGLARQLYPMVLTTEATILRIAATTFVLLTIFFAIAVSLDPSLYSTRITTTVNNVFKGVRSIYVVGTFSCFFIWLNQILPWAEHVTNLTSSERLQVIYVSCAATFLGFLCLTGNIATVFCKRSDAVSVTRITLWGAIVYFLSALTLYIILR